VAAQGCTLGATYIDDVPLGEVSYISVSKDMLVTEGTGTILIASNAAEYKWVPDIYLNCSDCPSPYVVAEKSQRYCVSDPTNGCAREACVLVEIVCVNRGDMSVPSAFTPNNDGRNDKFCLQGWKYCVSEFNIRIFNRWGQLVYETKENDFCWDGTFNGQDLDAGVYVYSIEAVLNREPYSKKGNITIIR
jgi:gliding motility-associated-like protein